MSGRQPERVNGGSSLGRGCGSHKPHGFRIRFHPVCCITKEALDSGRYLAILLEVIQLGFKDSDPSSTMTRLTAGRDALIELFIQGSVLSIWTSAFARDATLNYCRGQFWREDSGILHGSLGILTF